MNRTERQEIFLTDFFDVLWRRKWGIIAPTLAVAVIAGVVSFLFPRIWEVDAVFLPSKFLLQTEQGQLIEVLVVDPKQVASQINQASYNASIAKEMDLDLRDFPRLRAEHLTDTHLVRMSVRDEDVERGSRILDSLFLMLKTEFDRKIEVEVKGIDGQISKKQNEIKENEIEIRDKKNEIDFKRLEIEDKKNEIKVKENDVLRKDADIRQRILDVQSREIEKERNRKSIEFERNKIKISEERMASILEEMKSVKGRIDDLEKQVQKVLEERKAGGDAISLLLYSNEVQQNLRYYNTLDEKLSLERIARESAEMNIRNHEQNIRQLETQASQFEAQKDALRAELETIRNEIAIKRTEIGKVGTEIVAINNEIEKTTNKIESLNKEIEFLNDKKARIDHARLVKEPTSSLNPVSPKKKANILAALFISLVVFTTLAFFLEYLDKVKAVRRAD
ncbi:MAG: hypothetical protein FJY82_00810 [Candidatus Aminicenantes bacterium]|nr:hypothetical protein [Candidatus Aminicenantes bacterium]